MQKVYIYKDLPVGEILIGEKNGKINCVKYYTKNKSYIEFEKPYDYEETLLIKKTKGQLEEYFNSTRKKFEIDLLLEGTDFQKKVWDELKKIPYGETRSYKQIGENIGNPKGARAVGNANNKNPISIIIPCHRVIGKSGKMIGYGGGISKKELLLKLESNI